MMSPEEKEEKARESCLLAAAAPPHSAAKIAHFKHAISLVGYSKAEDLLNEALEIRKLLGG